MKKKMEHLIAMIFSIISMVVITVTMLSTAGSGMTTLQRKIKCSASRIPNGVYFLRKRDTVMRINCIQGYFLIGTKSVECINGRWDGEMPVCAKKGCPKKPQSPKNGLIQIEDDLRATLFCNENFKIAGGRIAYCNGSDWDRPLGTCREIQSSIQLGCDFETDDVCGWVYDEFGIVSWKRAMAANMFLTLRTGPQHDHTTMTANGGHYMLMESFTPKQNSTAQLISPIYPRELSLRTACCFRFYYFMYGATVGSLSVYVRPMSIDMASIMDDRKYLYFMKTGNQNNIWNEGFFDIEEMPDDFQIIFIGTSGISHLSDIAIDDVKLMTGIECRPSAIKEEELEEMEETLTSATISAIINDGDERNATGGNAGAASSATSNDEDVSQQTRDFAIFDVQSCEFRCSETKPSGLGVVMKNGLFYKTCDCHPECEETKSCCPNYHAICILEDDFMPTVNTAPSTFNDGIEKFSLNTTATVTTTKKTTTPSVVETKKTTPTPSATKTTAQQQPTKTTMKRAATTTKMKLQTTTTTTTTRATTTTTPKTPKTTAAKLPITSTKQRATSPTTTTMSTTPKVSTITKTTKTTTIPTAKIATTTTTAKPKTATATSYLTKATRQGLLATTTTKQNINPTTTTKSSTTTTTTTTTAILDKHQHYQTTPSLTAHLSPNFEFDHPGPMPSHYSTTMTTETSETTSHFHSPLTTRRMNSEQSSPPHRDGRKQITVWKINTDKHHNSGGNHSSIPLTIMTIISGSIMIAIILGAIYRRHSDVRIMNRRQSSVDDNINIDDGGNDGGGGANRNVTSTNRNRKSTLMKFLRRIFSSNNACESDSSSYNSDFLDTASLIYNSSHEDEILLHTPGTLATPVSTL